MSIDAEIVSIFTPTGRLRASINVGNPILASKDKMTGDPAGVSVDLARAFAQRLGVDIEFVVFDSAGKSVDAVTQDQADIGFFAIDPLRGNGIAFTEPYVLIEGYYVVPADSPIRANEDVDQENIRVTVGKGSAYDLYLTRELKSAQIVRAPTSPAVIETFLAEKADVAAGVKQQLEADLGLHPGLRLLPRRFMEIRQAMGVPKGRGQAAADVLAAFVLDMKGSGFVADALKRHGIKGAAVAP